jgi:hypothetical protein
LRRIGALGLILLCLGCAGHPSNTCAQLGAGAGCRSAMRQWIDAEFGAPPAEAYVAEGRELRRIFGVGAFHAIIGISFLHRPGGGSELRIDFARRRLPYASELGPIVTPIPEELWRRAVAATSDLGRIEWRTGGPVEPGSIIVCADGAIWGVEITERPRGPVRRRTSSSCEDKGLPRVADALISLARSAFPECRALKPRYRVEQYALMDCGLLAGDIMAAAEALNRFNEARLDDLDGRGPEEIGPFLAESMVLDWDGARVSGPAAVAPMLDRMARSARNTRLLIDRVTGDGAATVRMSGWALGYFGDPAGETEQRVAPWTQIWNRAAGGDFRLVRMEVGAWKPEPHSR